VCVYVCVHVCVCVCVCVCARVCVVRAATLQEQQHQLLLLSVGRRSLCSFVCFISLRDSVSGSNVHLAIQRINFVSA
jgi:hypothetical protein